MMYTAIGLMSGTSLDGLDLCCCQFFLENEDWKFNIKVAETLSYDQYWLDNLRTAPKLSSSDLLALHTEYGKYLGEKVSDFIQKNKLNNIDVIASHGHTIFHQPNRLLTFQLGDGRAIKIKNNLPVVYDFRSQDVLMGGNGAPLVPIGDQLLFSEYDACLNLGGFSNISFQKNGKRIAFDIAPVNIVLNKLSEALGYPFDDKGKIAQQHPIDPTVLNKLNSLDFYSEKPPKSLGLEWVEQYIFPLITELSPEVALATITQHCALQISKIIQEENLKKILVTGGGAYNDCLVSTIRRYNSAKIILPDPTIIQYKEALIFALMGVLKLLNKNNILSSATGSFADHSSGIVA